MAALPKVLGSAEPRSRRLHKTPMSLRSSRRSQGPCVAHGALKDPGLLNTFAPEFSITGEYGCKYSILVTYLLEGLIAPGRYIG